MLLTPFSPLFVSVCVIRRERAEAIATEKRKKGFPIKIPGIITLYSLPDGSYKLLDGQHRHATRPDYVYIEMTVDNVGRFSSSSGRDVSLFP
jgi:hypothetical protein